MSVIYSRKIIGILHITILFFLSTVVFISTYVPNTWFIGWDNVLPELNFKVNIFRYLFFTWQTDSGLGFTAVQSYGADLPRILLLYILGLLLPLSALRYFYAFLMFFTGGVLFYFFIKNLLSTYMLEQRTHVHRSLAISWIAFVCSFLYMFSIITIQHFYVMFEMFVHFYAFLPGALLVFEKVVLNKELKYLWGFVLVNIILSPIAYAATLWGVYMLVLSLLAINLLIFKKCSFYRVTLIFFLLIIVNSFWLFPAIQTLIYKAPELTQAKFNRITSPETLDRNIGYNSVFNIIRGNSYLMDMNYITSDNKVAPVLGNWRELSNSQSFNILSLSIFAFSISGLFLILKKSKSHIWLTSIFILSFLFLSGFLVVESGSWGLIKEMYRNPFTKFSQIYLLSLISMLGVFLANVYFFALRNSKFKRVLFGIFLSLIFLGNLYVYRGMFFGGIIAPYLKIEIPKEYFNLFDYSNTFISPEERIVLLPIERFWGWEQYKWGYVGSGFIWYGLRQPILHRAFDVWSPYNYQAYKDLRYQYVKGSCEGFRDTMNTYNLTWLLFDKSFNSSSDEDVGDFGWSRFLDSCGFTLVKKFGDDHLYLYRNLITKGGGVLSVLPSSDIHYSNLYNNLNIGTYYSSDSIDYIYPFHNFYMSLDTRAIKLHSQIKAKHDSNLLNKPARFKLSNPENLIYKFTLKLLRRGDSYYIRILPISYRLNVNSIIYKSDFNFIESEVLKSSPTSRIVFPSRDANSVHNQTLLIDASFTSLDVFTYSWKNISTDILVDETPFNLTTNDTSLDIITLNLQNLDMDITLPLDSSNLSKVNLSNRLVDLYDCQRAASELKSTGLYNITTKSIEYTVHKGSVFCPVINLPEIPFNNDVLLHLNYKVTPTNSLMPLLHINSMDNLYGNIRWIYTDRLGTNSDAFIPIPKNTSINNEYLNVSFEIQNFRYPLVQFSLFDLNVIDVNTDRLRNLRFSNTDIGVKASRKINKLVLEKNIYISGMKAEPGIFYGTNLPIDSGWFIWKNWGLTKPNCILNNTFICINPSETLDTSYLVFIPHVMSILGYIFLLICILTIVIITLRRILQIIFSNL